MPTVRFNIGEAFPADDPVARFVTVLGMMSNDWVRSMEDMRRLDDEDPDAAGRRVMLFRQQASLHHEAATFITESRRRFPEIDRFISGLEPDAQDECAHVVGGIDPNSPHYHGDWLADHRNVTFHCPEMHPDKAAHGQEEITEALREAAGLEGKIAAEETFGSVRFRFADDVAVQWLPSAETQVDVIEALRESVMALARFVQRAANSYLQSRPEGTIVFE